MPIHTNSSHRRCVAPLHLIVVSALAAFAPLALTQTSTTPAPAESTTAKLPEFEVATIRPVDLNKPHMEELNIQPGGRVIVNGLSLKDLVHAAFNLNWWQISGGDDWTTKVEYNIEAIPPESFRATSPNTRHTWYGIEDEHLRQMLQALLIDRFQLKFHRETKTGKIYLLERSGKTLALHPSEAAPGFSSIGWASHWQLDGVTMPQLASFASDNYLHSLVLDRTNLAGAFDYKSPPETPDADGREPIGSFETMIHDIGLKLEPSKGLIETFVIDHAEKPSPN